MDLLWERALEGNVSATKSLYEHYRRLQGPAHDEKPADDWSELYGDGDGKVTPIRKPNT